MKKFFLLPFCFLFIFCSNQIKLNTGKDIDIIFPLKQIDTQAQGHVIEEILKNNTDKTLIIDPLGFYGESYVLENGKVLKSYLYLKSGHYFRDYGLCREDLVILQPFQTIHHSIIFDKNDRVAYQYMKPNQYEKIIKSSHDRYNATILGCDDYIKELESQGYKVLEDSIVAKIPLKP